MVLEKRHKLVPAKIMLSETSDNMIVKVVDKSIFV